MINYFPPIDKAFKYLQTNRSNILGSIWASFNLDFQSNLGILRLAQKLVINTASTDDSDLGTPSAFEFWNTKWWAICDTTLFSSASADVTSAWTEDAGTGAVKTYDFQQSDLAVFDNRLWTTSGGLSPELFSRTGTTFTSRDTLGASALHKLLYFNKFARLYYGNTATTICSIDAANAVADPGADYAIDLGSNVVGMTTMVATSNLIWIATIKGSNTSATEGTYGSILSWDGFSAQISNEYILPAGGVLAMVVLNDVPYAIDSEGRILKFTGYSFEEIGRLPINRTLLIGATSTTGGQASGRFVHFNGMVATKNNTLLISIKNLNEDQQADFNENMPSGVWEFDLGTGNFTHRHSFGLKTLASSTITDFGQNIISRIGALKINPFSTNSATTGKSGLLAGARIFTDGSTTKSAIFIDSPSKMVTDTEGQKRGYVVTTWFESLEITYLWTKIWSIFRRYLNSTDKITFKYRLSEEDPTYIDITWVDTTHFTTATDPSSYAPSATPFDGTTGGEVEILQGTGAGSCTHITAITGPSGGLYTITLDNAVTGVTTGTAKARLQKWAKLEEISAATTPPAQILSYGETPINKNDTRIQIKAVFEWTGDNEFIKMLLLSDDDVKPD